MGIIGRQTFDDLLDKFCESKNPDIIDSQPRTTGCDVEACYLCQAIWYKVTGNTLNNGKPYSNNYFDWNNGKIEKTVRFHLDIMNNPKIGSCGLAASVNETGRNNWETVYHHIGNMTPIPWFDVAGNHSVNGQMLHKALDERWDLYLNVLRRNWDAWNKTEGFTFNGYMILTCQQMYYADIYESIEDTSEITLDSIAEWNGRIIENPEMDLLSFEPYDGRTIDTVADDIIKLIKIRDRVIGLKLDASRQ